MDITTDDWHVQIRSLLSACLGQITQNMRLISLRFKDDYWVVHFVLETESTADREVIEEIFEDFDVSSWNAISGERSYGSAKFSSAVDRKIKKEVTITAGEIEREQEELLLWIYRRREIHHSAQ